VVAARFRHKRLGVRLEDLATPALTALRRTTDAALTAAVTHLDPSLDYGPPVGDSQDTPIPSIGTTRLTLWNLRFEGPVWVAVFLGFCSLMLAGAIAFDDWNLTEYQLQLADALGKLLGGGAVFLGALRYLDERAQRLAWDKTKFITELFEDFDQAADCQLARRIIDRAYQLRDFSYLERVLGDPAELTEDEWAARDAIDRFLDFFDQLYTHVFITSTLGLTDVSSFSGYVIQVADNDCLSTFALRWGYEDVIEFAAAFEKSAAIRVRRADELERGLED
jgi:hypothetical protein